MHHTFPTSGPLPVFYLPSEHPLSPSLLCLASSCSDVRSHLRRYHVLLVWKHIFHSFTSLKLGYIGCQLAAGGTQLSGCMLTWTAPASKPAAWDEGLGSHSWIQCGALQTHRNQRTCHGREEVVDPTCLAKFPEQEPKCVNPMLLQIDLKAQQQ